MQIKEIINYAFNTANQTVPIKILQDLAKAYVLKGKISKIPNNINQEDINKFFQELDDSGVGEKWQLISLLNVRKIFNQIFKGIYTIPAFPCLSKEVKDSRK